MGGLSLPYDHIEPVEDKDIPEDVKERYEQEKNGVEVWGKDYDSELEKAGRNVAIEYGDDSFQKRAEKEEFENSELELPVSNQAVTKILRELYCDSTKNLLWLFAEKEDKQNIIEAEIKKIRENLESTIERPHSIKFIREE